ncbi:CRTAC1 family protein [Myxococcota bacterium]|nr:CRTAC1 family protein [Myxococcota bacterium]MBU1537544.1 CRTAC1 family protein [Myxococcota bacterium]
MKTLLSLALVVCFPLAAMAQSVTLAYDDGTPAGTVQSLDPGDVEVTRLTPLHPATVDSLSIWFGSVNGPATIYIWADNGGNAPDLDRVLWSGEVLPVEDDWTVIDLAGEGVDIDPPVHFYVGQIVEDATTLIAWDASGADETRSLIRDEGEWYYVGDGETPARAVDALIRATVTYHDIPQTYWFTDITESSGLSGLSRMAFGDYDNDGDDDLLVNGNTLYRNEGDGTFTNVSEEAGIAGRATNGGIWADYDNDGHLDFYATVNNYLPLCSSESDCPADGFSCVEGRCKSDSNAGERPHDYLWRNNGDGTFTDVSDEAGAPYDFLPTEGAAWGDVNGDGFVDLYVANYETPTNWTDGTLSIGTADKLWMNMGDGTFADFSAAHGIEAEATLCGRGVNMADYDDDGDLDIYVSNYRLHRNFLWQNSGSGRFTNVGFETGTEGEYISGAYGHTIGSTWVDLNNDGHWDLIAANLAHPRFIEFSDKTMIYINSGPPDYTFEDIREESGVTYSETHSDPAAGDFDNDGYADFFVTDVYVGYQSFLYRNNGDLTFTDVTYPSGIRVDNGWGCAWADIDNDGDLDLVSRGLYRNDHATGNYLKVRLIGTYANRSAIGARVTLNVGGDVLMRQVEGGKGTTTQNSMTLHFGLGDATMVDSLTIDWPLRTPFSETYGNVTANRTVTYVEREGELLPDGGVDGGDDDPGDSGGCSCSTGQSGSAPPLMILFLAILAIFLRSSIKNHLRGAPCGR